MTDGFLYVATGEKYLKEATLSAKSLKKVMPSANITLVTDLPHSSDIFDKIIIQSFESIDNASWKANLVYKIIGIQKSPYQKTIFIDTDTYIAAPIEEMFGMLEYFDILICHDYYEDNLIAINQKKILGFHPYNTGVIAYKTDSTKKFLESWKNIYINEIDEFWSDQPAFIKALATAKNIKTHVLRPIYNFRFNNNIAFPNNQKVKIIHGRTTQRDFKKIADRINQNTSQRAWVANRRKCYTNEEKNLPLLFIKKIYSTILKILK